MTLRDFFNNIKYLAGLLPSYSDKLRPCVRRSILNIGGRSIIFMTKTSALASLSLLLLFLASVIA